MKTVAAGVALIQINDVMLQLAGTPRERSDVRL